MVESIEHLSAELHLHLLSDLKRLDETKVDIPVTRRDEDISSRSVLSRRRNAERLRQIDAARQRVNRLEQNGTGEWRVRQFLQLRSRSEEHTSELQSRGLISYAV